jgi:hypothetical protein
VTGAAVSDDAAGADFAAGYVKEKLYVGARGERMGNEKERSAYAQLLGVRDVALSGALPSDQQALGRAIPRMAAAFVSWNFDGKSL